jgi:diguanylate cyclase (GGDEF)-like protein
MIYAGGGVLSLVAAAVVWRRRSAPGGRSLLWVLAAAAWWCLADALESAVVGIPAHVLWAQVAYLGNMPIGVLLLHFAMAYTGRPRPPKWLIGCLFVIPAIGAVGAFTNQWTRAIWTSFAVVPGNMNLVLYSHGWLAWVTTVYELLIALLAGAILLGFALRAKAAYRQQSALIFAAVLVPWVAEIVYVTNGGIAPGVDPSVTIAVSGFLLAIGLVRFRLLDLVPVARDRVIEDMTDGLLVLDGEGRILDSNPAAARILEAGTAAWIGVEITAALIDWPEMASALRDGCTRNDTTLCSPAGRTIHITCVPLDPGTNNLNGTLVTLRDATRQAETEAALQALNSDLHARVAQIEALQDDLREQSTRDPLTGLFNRRYLSETLAREIGRARREGYPVSVAMIDVDHFKDINDRHGHVSGDQVLRFLGAQLHAGLRTGDIACRFGGDEFVMVLPNAPIDVAAQRGEEWRGAVEEASLYWMEWAETSTISVGVAAFPQNGATVEELMAAADAALYVAKSGGRNRMVVSQHETDAARDGRPDALPAADPPT